MFGFSLASHLLQGPTQRTWNCVSHFANLVWNKFFYIGSSTMPRSRKRHHTHSKSRSRSRSRSPHTRDHSYERSRKDSHEKDGKRRKIDGVDSPPRSLSPTNEAQSTELKKETREELVAEQTAKDVEMVVDGEAKPNVENIGADQNEENSDNKCKRVKDDENEETNIDPVSKKSNLLNGTGIIFDKTSQDEVVELSDSDTGSLDTSKKEASTDAPKKEKINNGIIFDKTSQDEIVELSDSDTGSLDTSKKEASTDTPKKEKIVCFSNKPLTPKQIQKKAIFEKKRQEKLKEKEEKLKQKMYEKLKAKQQKDEEKQKQLEEKRIQQEQRQKEKELKEEQKKKEKEEKERKRKEKEELEEQKRKEKELEKLKKQQEIEEKEKEKQKEQEKKQKSAKLLISFFKKTENPSQDEKKSEKVAISTNNFMPFEVKSDMKLPPSRREPLSEVDISNLDDFIRNQDETASYLKDLKTGKKLLKSGKTWPVEDEPEEEDVMIVEDKKLGETICEDTSTAKKMRAKFLFFRENRRPPYFGTWRKKSKVVKPKRPLAEDNTLLNYEEDSDDDWEEEEQGESLDVSDEEGDKETEEEKDDYEVDNEFFVAHGHLSDDEVDDEENTRLSPESMKQKLKLLKDEFDQDMKLKTHKLKPRSIGCVWFNKAGDNVEEAIKRYLQPFAALVNGQVEIKKRSEIFATPGERKKVKVIQELPQDHIPLFLNIIHGNSHNQKALIEQFMTYMVNNGMHVEVSKANLVRYLKKSATYKKFKDPGTMKNKCGWFLNEDVREKYSITLNGPSEKSD